MAIQDQNPLKTLILFTLVTSLTTCFFPELKSDLLLSWGGIKSFHLWQLITYIFVDPFPLSLSFLINLGFNLFLLWVFGSSLIERAHSKKFFVLYFGSALFASLASLSVLPYSPIPLAGCAPSLFAILAAWMMLYPEADIMLFLTVPVRSCWLVVGLLGFNLAIDLSVGNYPHAVSIGAASLFGYVFALVAWREQGPFSILYPLERFVLRLLERKREAKSYKHTKIFDIRSGEPVLSDEAFMDSMLARISKYGEEILTPEERKRMEEISERKNRYK
jgi:membrane associated rhomboid family serine protease